MIDKITSWEDLDADIDDLFNNAESITGKRFGHVYAPLKSVVANVKDKFEEYKTNPKDFSRFILQNPNHVDNLFDWLPYLSGDRAKLVDMKFFNKNDEEIIDKSLITKMLNDDDPVKKETYVYIFINNSRVEELNNGSKLLQENNNQSEHTVYADVNPPALNLKNIRKRLKK